MPAAHRTPGITSSSKGALSAPLARCASKNLPQYSRRLQVAVKSGVRVVGKNLPPVHASANLDDSDVSSSLNESLRLGIAVSSCNAMPQKPPRPSGFFRSITKIIRAFEQISGLIVGAPVGEPLGMIFPFGSVDAGNMFVDSGLRQRIATTARELEANVFRPTPLRHAAFVRDLALVKLLAATAQSADIVDVVLVDRHGEYSIPVLARQCFDEPADKADSGFDGVHHVTGFDINKSTTHAMLRLDYGAASVFPTPKISEEVHSLSVADFEADIYIEGHWVRTTDGGWQTQAGARLVFQREFALAAPDEPESNK